MTPTTRTHARTRLGAAALLVAALGVATLAGCAEQAGGNNDTDLAIDTARQSGADYARQNLTLSLAPGASTETIQSACQTSGGSGSLTGALAQAWTAGCVETAQQIAAAQTEPTQ